MSLEDCRRICGELMEMGGVKVIKLFNGGEPLLHPAICHMVDCARRATPKVLIKTNATKLTHTLARGLVDAGLTHLGISIIAPDNELYQRISQSITTYQDILENVQRAWPELKGRVHVRIKMADCGFSDKQIEQFKTDFSTLCDECCIENLHQGAGPVIGNDYQLGTRPCVGDNGEPLVKKCVCAFPFYQLVFNSSGKVLVCCADWAEQTEVGSIDEPVREIWNGERLRRLRILHLTGNRWNNQACNTCDIIDGLLDNLDSNRQEILKRIE